MRQVEARGPSDLPIKKNCVGGGGNRKYVSLRKVLSEATQLWKKRGQSGRKNSLKPPSFPRGQIGKKKGVTKILYLPTFLKDSATAGVIKKNSSSTRVGGAGV